jgi:hypothetical protein
MSRTSVVVFVLCVLVEAAALGWLVASGLIGAAVVNVFVFLLVYLLGGVDTRFLYRCRHKASKVHTMEDRG